MKNKYFVSFLLALLCISFSVKGQELPYRNIPKAADKFTAGSLMSRMVDGLGFRFYWATEALQFDDITFRPSEEARSIEETVDHIYGLTLLIVNAVMEQPTVYPIDISKLSFEQKRSRILSFLETASKSLLICSEEDFKRFNMVTKAPGGQSSSLPFWNVENGPLADALWHTGQIVSLRRMAGNPFNSKVNVLTGQGDKP